MPSPRPHFPVVQTSEEHCETCIWQMQGVWKEIQYGKGQELWCGAGLEEVFHRMSMYCNIRVPFISLEYDFDAHQWINAIAADDSDILRPDVRAWIKEAIPNTRVETLWSRNLVLINFVSENDAMAFRLRWG